MLLLSTDLAWAIRHFDFNLLIDPDVLNLQRNLTQHDVFKLDKILDDLASYLSQLKRSLLLSQLQKDDILYFSDGRETVVKMLQIASKIDEFVSTVLVVPLVLDNSVLTAKLKSISLALLDCKQALLATRNKVDIVSNYHEIKYVIIEQLLEEVRRCTASFELCHQSSLPLELPTGISLEQITTKMRLNDISHNRPFSMRSITFPVFTDQEREAYYQFETLEGRLDPIQVSMDFVQQRVQGFNSMCGAIFPSAIIELNREYDRLVNLWDNLLSEFISVKKHTVDTRWHSIFLFLIDYILQKSLEMIAELQKDRSSGVFQISDLLGSSFKTCSNVITLIHKAFMENVIYDKSLTRLYNETLLPKWQELNKLLENDLSADVPSYPTPNTFTEEGYRPIRMVQRRTPLAESDENTRTEKTRNERAPLLGIGLDLGLGINACPSVPFSISKKDRIVDLSIDLDNLPRTNIQKTLMELLEAQHLPEDDDMATLVHETPFIEQKSSFESTRTLLRKPTAARSKIPVIVYNYSKLGYPVIKKKLAEGHRVSRIPSISPLHSVFISPERRLVGGVVAEPTIPEHVLADEQKENLLPAFRKLSFHSPELTFASLRSPPQFTLSRSYRNGNRRVSSSDGSMSGDDIFRSNRSRSSSLRLKADRMSLVGILTPNLAYGANHLSDFSPDQLSLRSTSPERPESSIGSRFDDNHLTQPLKSSKKLWR